jgi:hypothetical protein
LRRRCANASWKSRCCVMRGSVEGLFWKVESERAFRLAVKVKIKRYKPGAETF